MRTLKVIIENVTLFTTRVSGDIARHGLWVLKVELKVLPQSLDKNNEWIDVAKIYSQFKIPNVFDVK